MLRTCCPQYTIRLEVAAFKPSRQQRGTINKWNRFLLGDKGEKTGKGKQKEFDLWAELNKYTEEECQHKFEVRKAGCADRRWNSRLRWRLMRHLSSTNDTRWQCTRIAQVPCGVPALSGSSATAR